MPTREQQEYEMRQDTRLVRGGQTRSGFDETAEALFLTSGYVYDSAEQAEATFAGDVDHYIYSRYGNPTVTMFEERLRLLEGSEDAWSTASGMAAVFWSLASLLEQGDRVVASRDLFGSCFVILNELLPRWGIHTEFVNGASLDEWEKALATPAKVVFFESPSNPMQGLVNVSVVSELAHAAGATVVVDNVFATPILQQPLSLGADVVVYSTTKHIDGQGRTMGGAILGSSEYVQEQLKPFMRHTGPTLSPFNAWVLVKSLETLKLRVEHQTQSAHTLAAHLEGVDGVARVWYPGLASHPQADLAAAQMAGGGTVVTFEVGGGKERAFRVLNGVQIIDISNNLGDSKSLITHPATTTHRRIGPEARSAMGITDGVIRLSVGLEDVEDLKEDLSAALEAS
jgi:O-succinylhomoserine sulfhydrylase